MEIANKIVREDAKRILKNIGKPDSEIVDAYIEIIVKDKMRGHKLFDNILVGIIVTSLTISLATVLFMACIGISRKTDIDDSRNRVLIAEERIRDIDLTISQLKEQDEILRRLEDVCSSLEK